MTDQSSERYERARNGRLSGSMMSALGSMPITLRSYDNGQTYHLPVGSPSGGTLQALERRGLAESDDRTWSRTPLGEATWEAR